jgi:hypothetical protein
MFEEIRNRIAYLTQTKTDIMELYRLSNDEVEQVGLSERNMQISMELSFLNKLLQYDVSGRSEQLKAISDLTDFAYEVCPLHREDDLEDIVGRL